MNLRTVIAIFSVFPLVLWGQEEADEMGKPALYGPALRTRFVASYGVLEDREPELQELEISLLEKIGPMVEENPEFAKSMLEGMLGEEAPATATFNFILANLYFNGGALEDALAEYDRAIEKFPTVRRAWKNLGMLKTRNADYEGAVEALVRCIELGDTSPDTYGTAAYGHLRVGNLMAAELAYNAAVMLEPNNIEWIEGKAQAMISGKRFREAVPLLEELLKRNPQRAIYRTFLANVYVETEQFLKAAQVFELMHSMGEGDMATRLQLANIYSLQGMYDLSVDTFVAAQRADLVSLLPQVLTTVRYLLEMEELEQAKRLFANLGPLGPLWSSENRTRYLLLESSFAARAGESQLVEAKLVEALENDPTEGEALVRLGSIHAERGEKAKAMFFFERAYSSENHEYDALILASEVLIGSKRFGESLDLLQRALNKQPTSELKLLIDQVKAAALQ